MGHSPASIAHALFRQKPTCRSRRHQPIELFQKRNTNLVREQLTEAGYDKINEETAAAEDEDGWVDESESTAATRIKDARKRRMGLRVQITQQLWAAADPEERATCERLAAAEKLPSTAGPLTTDDAEPTPEQRQV
jgi:hypothetical protein